MPAALVAVVAAASCTGSPPERDGGGPPGHPRATGPAGELEAPDVSMRLVKLRISPVARHRVPPETLSEPAEAVRRSIEDLYRTAFVEPERWEDGDYARLFSHFSAAARERARNDLDILTLGAAAAEVDVVQPTRAILKLEFLLDRHDRPLVAFAETEFEATAISGETGSPITHRAHYVFRRLNGAWRIDSYEIRGRIPRPAQGRTETGEVSFAPGVPGSDPLNVLVIGSDARPGQPVMRTRADSIHILSVDPRSGRASVLGIPRDSWVPIRSHGTNKINAALFYGGPPLLVDTVERLSGVRIDSYLLTGFWGFSQMVDAVGGVEITIPYPVNLAEVNIRKGPQRIDGRRALAFARARKSVPGGDLGRSLNQGRVLVAALATLRRQASRGPAALLPWIIAGARHIHTDVKLDDLFALALAATTFEPRRVRNEVASGRTDSIGGTSVVLLDANARATFRDLARDGVLDS